MTVRIEVIRPWVNGKIKQYPTLGRHMRARRWVFTCWTGTGAPALMLSLNSYSEVRRRPGTDDWVIIDDRFWTYDGKGGIPGAEVPVPLWVQYEAARNVPMHFHHTRALGLAEFAEGNGRIDPGAFK